MQVTSKIKLNLGNISKLTPAAVKALEMTAEALHTEVVQAQVIPRDTGALQNEKFFIDYSEANSGSVKLCFEGPYARRLYYHPEYNFNRVENIAAGGRWMEQWLPKGKRQDFCKKAFEQFYKQEADL